MPKISKEQKLFRIRNLDNNNTFYSLTVNIVRYMSRNNPFDTKNVEIELIKIPKDKCIRLECVKFITEDENCINKRIPRITGMWKIQKSEDLITYSEWSDCED